jgi:hypothetical protein
VPILTINRGLVTSPNELARPDGAADVLDNCVIDSDNVVEPRRGFAEFGNATDDESVVKQLLTYKGRVLRHFANKLSFDSTGNGSFLNFSGTYSELVSRLRIRYFELNSNLYFTTSEGIKKISAKSADDFSNSAEYITKAGGVKATGLELNLVPSASGFLPAQSKVAYKVLWAKKDVNGNIIRGVPSSRHVITNISQDINVGESFTATILDSGAGIHKSFDSTTSVNAAIITITSHGFTAGTKVRFYGIIPKELDSSVTYYVVNVTTTDVFGVSLTSGGTAISLTDAVGTGNIYSGISNNDFFLFDSPTNKFATWFNVSGSDPSPTSSLLLGRQLIEVPIYNIALKNKINYASKIAEVLFSISDIQVEVASEVVTITNIDGGDVLDASQGSLDITYGTISTAYDGQTSIGIPSNTQVITTVPSGINSKDFFYEVYRTAVITVSTGLTLNDIDPGEEFQKIYESPVSLTNVIPLEVTFDDYIPETFREGGVYLYINPVTGESALQANEAPPIAHDVAIFKGSAFYANTKEVHRLQFSMLSVFPYNSGSSKLHVGNSTKMSTYTFIGQNEIIQFTAKKKSETVGGSYFDIYNAQNKIKYRTWFDKGSIVFNFDQTAINSTTEEITLSNHGFATNDLVTIDGTTLPGGLLKKSYYAIRVSSNTIKLSDSINGSAINLDSSSGSASISHISKAPSVDNCLLLKIPLLLPIYEDTVEGSVDAFADAFFDINDFNINDNIYHLFDSFYDINGSTETINIKNHSFFNNDQVTFSQNCPDGILIDTPYYVTNKTNNSFGISTSIGGPSVNITPKSGAGKVTFVAPSSIVKLVYTDNGDVSSVVQSSSVTGWSDPVVLQQGDGEDASLNQVLLSGLSSQSLSIEDTARSLERVINKDPNSPVNAYYISGLNDLQGILLLESRSLIDDPFYVGFSEQFSDGFGNPIAVFEPNIPVAKTITSVVSSSPEAVFYTSPTLHGFTQGQELYTYIDPLLISPTIVGKKFISNVSSTTSFKLSGVSSSSYSSFDTAIVFPADVVSDNSVNPNRVYFSKIYQPEAVPLVNYIDIGPRDKKIQRIIALRDSLAVLKEEGVYIISGQSAPNFSVRLCDSSALTLAPDTAVNLNNLVYVLTSQGVVTVSETGVQVMSRNIENKIQEVTNSRFDYKLMSWGMSSESDRCYLLWLPEKTTDGYATQAFRYNTFTRAWTRWTKPANCGVVNPLDDKMYLGDSSGRPYVLQERKNFERQDHSDREIIRSIIANSTSGTTYSLSLSTELAAGDVLTQIQYLDINKFNRFLKKLDRDGFSSHTEEKYITLKASAGDSLGAKLQEVEVKLLSDGIIIPPSSGSDIAIDIATNFNAIVSILNLVTTLTNFKDYKSVSDPLIYEVLITGANTIMNTITVKSENKFVLGSVSIFKGIKCVVQYAPQHFGKPEATKQISEGTFIFDQNNFWGGSIAYSSDRSYDFKSIDVQGRGPGYWDGYNWANATFGGEGNEVPFRTFVPSDKARCRYLHVQFTHINAREQWKLIGVSLEPREVSTRGYR